MMTSSAGWPCDDRAMDDDRTLVWNTPPSPQRLLKPSELLFEFVRASDREPMSCELWFNGGRGR